MSLFSGAQTPEAVLCTPTPYQPLGPLPADAPQGRVALGHRRLSIVDLAPSGHQPMTFEEGRFTIVYNGEVYNHPELRAELVAKGHVFASRSDTEVVLAAYREWGVSCLHRFNGMFAFLIHDRQAGTVFAARDRFGVKPLYYWRSPEGLLAFASEIKQFTVLPGWRARLNAQRVYDFMSAGIADHCDETMFADVRQLRGGQFILSDLNTLAEAGPLLVQRWYELQPRPEGLSFERASERFRELFTQSIELRLRAEVPVGTGLSGGLDSSSIVCQTNLHLRQSGSHVLQNTFSACAQLKQYDEREYINEVVGHTQVKAHYVFPDVNELLERLGLLTWHQDEPFAGTSIFAEWCVYQSVATTDVKVTLDGHGADEMLAGYHSFFPPHLGKLFRQGHWRRLRREIEAARRIHGHGNRQAIESICSNLLPHTVLEFLRRAAGKVPVTADWMNIVSLGVDDYAFFDRWEHSEDVQALSRSQLLVTSLPVQLHWADRDSMAHGIESRLPFLDYRLVEFVLGCEDEFKLSEGQTKRMLREGMRGVLPEKVRTRQDKMGFVTPEVHWMQQESRGRFLAMVDRAHEQCRGVLNQKALDKAHRILHGQEAFNRFAWRMISLGAWMERFGVSA